MPSMDYTVEGQNGQSGVVDDDYVANQFKGMGYPVQGTTPDGMNLTLAGQPGPNGEPGAPQQWPISDALKSTGHTVKSVSPISSDSSTVEPMISGKVSALPPDDNIRKSYIQNVLASRGVENPQVTGSGGDWHVFNPHTNQWAQVSKDPGFDLSGLASLGVNAPHMIGSVLGGAAGAIVGEGVGSIPGAIAGAGVGSAAGTALTQGALAEFDPNYAAALHGHLNEVGTDALKTTGLDMLGEGIGAPLGKVLGKTVQPAADLAGSALEGGGDIVSGVAKKIANSDQLTNLATDFANPLPGANFAGIGSQALQAPKDIVSALGKVPGKLAEESEFSIPFTNSKFTIPAFLKGEAADKAQLLSHALGGPSGEFSAADVLGAVAGGRGKRAAAEYAGDAAAQAEESDAANAAMHMGSQFGITDEKALHELAQGQASDYAKGEIQRRLGTMGAEENWGSKTGQVLDKLSAAGQGLQGVANASTRAMLRGAQAVGTGASMAGKVIPPATQALRWAGLPWAARYGLVPLGENYYDEENH